MAFQPTPTFSQPNPSLGPADCDSWVLVDWKGIVDLGSYTERLGSHHRGAPGFLFGLPLPFQKVLLPRAGGLSCFCFC